MNSSDRIYADIQKTKGINKIIKKILFRLLLFFIKEMEKQEIELQQAMEHLAEQIQVTKQLSQELQMQKNALLEVRENYRERIEMVEVNLRNNNVLLEKTESDLDMYRIKISKLEKEGGRGRQVVTGRVENVSDVDASAIVQKNVYTGIDYFEFENYFRGSQNQIKENQKIYLPYFEGHQNVVDLGCGRGEFLELMKENDIEAYGVDLYEEFVELCTEKGLRAVYADAIGTIESAEKKFGGIFAGQIVEHLTLQQLVRLCEAAYEKLEVGACLIMETPNPTSLAIYTHAFYIDPSHQKPVHPLTLQYLLERAGFRNIEVVYTESSKLPVKIPELKIVDVENLEMFNSAMSEVQNTLFGSQDYAIIARK